jgi:hypothetical protein
MIKNRLEYALLLLAAGVFHIFLVDYLSFLVFAFFLVLPVISLLITLLASRGIMVELEINKDHIQKNEALSVQLKAKSKSVFMLCRVRVNMAVQNELLPEAKTETFLFLSAGRKEQIIEHDLSSLYSGKLDCRIKELRIYDYLGLFSFRRKPNDQQGHTVFVFPAAFPLKDMDKDSKIAQDIAGDETSPGKAGDDPSELFDVREYKDGDSLTRIHWKLSGKYESMMVKDYAQEVSDDILLLFDLNGSSKELDGLMDTIRSVSGFLLEHRVAHKMEWYDSLHGHFVHTSIVQEDDLNIALNAVLSVGRRQPGPMALMNFGSSPAHNHYADVIYLCSRAGFTPDALALLRDRQTESRIRILVVTAEPADLGKTDAAHAAALELSLTVIDSENVEKSLNALLL